MCIVSMWVERRQRTQLERSDHPKIKQWHSSNCVQQNIYGNDQEQSHPFNTIIVQKTGSACRATEKVNAFDGKKRAENEWERKNEEEKKRVEKAIDTTGLFIVFFNIRYSPHDNICGVIHRVLFFKRSYYHYFVPFCALIELSKTTVE